MEKTDKILGDCDCPGGPVVTSFKYPDAKYVHVETERGIRCCRVGEDGVIHYGALISHSEKEKVKREGFQKAAKERHAKNKEKNTALEFLKKKRAANEDITTEDLNSLVDAILAKA